MTVGQTFRALHDATTGLNRLLADPRYGLLAWNEAVLRRMTEIANLMALLGVVADSPLTATKGTRTLGE